MVDYAIKLRDEAEYLYDQVWCVFDKDDFSDFDDAISYAYKQGLHVAYSNEAFELWYLLHYDYLISALHRGQYQNILSDRLGRKYKKNDPTIYDDILDKQNMAIQNAKKLMDFFNSSSPSKSNPSTTVYKLVIELNKFM